MRSTVAFSFEGSNSKRRVVDVFHAYEAEEDSWEMFPSLAQRRRNHAGVYIPAEAGGTGTPGIWVFGGRQTSDTNCLLISEYNVIDAVGVEEQPGLARNAFSVAPNPSRGNVTVRFAPTQVGAQLRVFDVLGKPVWTGTAGHSLRLTGLAAGTYILRLDAPSGPLERKLVVTR